MPAAEAVNPYAPVATGEPVLAWTDQRFAFDTDVTSQDVIGALRRPRQFFIMALWLMLPFSVLALVLLGSLLAGQAPNSLLATCGMLGLLMTYFLWNAWRNLGPALGLKRIRGNPLILGPVRGSFDKDYYRWQREHCQGVCRTESMCYAIARGSMLEFAFDQPRLAIHMLPARAFDAGGFEQLRDLLTQIAKTSTALPTQGMVDPRMLEQERLIRLDLSPDASRFEGTFRTRDVLESALQSYLRQALWRSFLVMGGVDLVLFLLLFWLTPLGIGWFAVLGLLLFLNWSFFKSYRAGVAWTHSPDLTLMHVCGGVSSANVTMGSPVGAATYQWDVFEDAYYTENTVSLRLPGTIGHHVVLTRHLFRDEADWQTALELCQANCRPRN